MSLPGAGSPPKISMRGLTPEDWEDAFQIYRMDLYKEDSRGHRLFQQRTVLVSTRSLERLSEEIAELVAQMCKLDPSRDYHYMLTCSDEFYEEKDPTVPFDSGVVAAASPLSLARRSPKTGNVYHDATMQVCPHTGAKMNFFITRAPS